VGGNDIRSMRESGILPMAINSLLAKMGTSDAVEAFADMQKLIDGFDFKKFGRAPANYDAAELDKLNEKLLHQLPFSAVQKELPFADETFWNSVRANVKNMSEAKQWWEILNGNIAAELNHEERNFLRATSQQLPPEPWSETTYDTWLATVKPTTERKGKELFMPIRKALTGLEHGPELKKLLPLLGAEKTKQRLQG
jgi:glutamyl-tRNA synthetase